MAKKDLTLVETLAYLYEASIRTEAKLDAILNIQAHLVSKANGTTEDEEFTHISKMVENLTQTKLDKLGFTE